MTELPDGVRPLRKWGGYPVPYVTAWTSEAIPPQNLTIRRGYAGVGLGFPDEDDRIDRQMDVLWTRMPATPGAGRPRFEMVHGLRQRQAMCHLKCQMCGGLALRPDGRLLFLTGSASGRPIAEGEHTTAPPIHAVCARIALTTCPFLRRGWAAALVSQSPIWGVHGVPYDSQLRQIPTPTGAHAVPFEDSEDLRWILAARLVVALQGVEALDPRALIEEPCSGVRDRGTLVQATADCRGQRRAAVPALRRGQPSPHEVGELAADRVRDTDEGVEERRDVPLLDAAVAGDVDS